MINSILDEDKLMYLLGMQADCAYISVLHSFVRYSSARRWKKSTFNNLTIG